MQNTVALQHLLSKQVHRVPRLHWSVKPAVSQVHHNSLACVAAFQVEYLFMVNLLDRLDLIVDVNPVPGQLWQTLRMPAVTSDVFGQCKIMQEV